MYDDKINNNVMWILFLVVDGGKNNIFYAVHVSSKTYLR